MVGKKENFKENSFDIVARIARQWTANPSFISANLVDVSISSAYEN